MRRDGIRVPLAGRFGSILAWPLGVAITSWVYVWRTTPIHRRELDGTLGRDLPPPLPETIAADAGVQRPENGAGPFFHRTYTGRIVDGTMSAAELIARLKADPNFVAPLALARFRKVSGPPWQMELGDEFGVRMPGPWDGPIRVIALSDRSFRFVTLRGHLEAGQIEWRVSQDGDALVFQIESWARAGDWLSALLHDHLRMAKEVQLHMWTSVVEKVARRCRGRLQHGIEIETRRIDAEAFATRPAAR